MNLQALKNELKQKIVRPFYIFTGDEWQGQLIYINQISKVKELSVNRLDSISKVYMKLKSGSFISNSSIYVVRDDVEFIQNEKLQENVKGSLGNNVYILLLTSVDKRTKFYKKYKDDIVEFEYFDDKVLIKYIQKEIDLSPANCKKLIDVCESDYGRILLEIDKIKRYCDAG